MQTAQRLDLAIELARKLGYQVRFEHLDGNAGGGCQIRGTKVLFVDLALSPHEQLNQVIAALQRDETLARLAS